MPGKKPFATEAKKMKKSTKKELAKAAVAGAMAGAMENLGSKKLVGKSQAAPQMGHSPAEMSPYKMESAKQEKYNLMHDNPVAKDASGGRSWMSKHVHKMGGSPIKKHCM